jgi:hypothetical protein
MNAPRASTFSFVNDGVQVVVDRGSALRLHLL